MVPVEAVEGVYGVVGVLGEEWEKVGALESGEEGEGVLEEAGGGGGGEGWWREGGAPAGEVVGGFIAGDADVGFHPEAVQGEPGAEVVEEVVPQGGDGGR